MRIAEALVLAALVTPAHASVQQDVLGDWQTEDGQGVIRVGPCGTGYCGVIVGTSEYPANGDALRDVHGRPQCHLSIINGLHIRDDSRLHGTVTNPEDGRTYSAEVWVAPDHALRLRGYIGLPLLGSTQIWPHFNGTVAPNCQFHRG